MAAPIEEVTEEKLTKAEQAEVDNHFEDLASDDDLDALLKDVEGCA